MEHISTKQISKSHQIHKNPALVICDSVDVFYDNYDITGNLKIAPIVSSEIETVILKPTKKSHALEIVNFYQTIYKGTYPYKEMLDPDFVFQTFSDPKYYWGIFQIKENGKLSNKIVGCFTVVMDLDKRAGYMRGLNILPRFQGRIGVRELSYAMIKRFFRATKGKIDKWYNEARSAHNKIQHLSRVIAARIHAVFLNKDYFFGKKETDCLMVGYWDYALHETRKPPTFLHEKISKFYYRAKKMHNLEKDPEIISDINYKFNKSTIKKFMNSLNISIKEDKYGYVNLKFENTFTGEFLSALHTKSVKNIEKIKYNCTNPETLMIFKKILELYIENNGIEYIEWHVPACDLLTTQFLLDSNFFVLGYVPAWIKDEFSNELFNDAIVFGWTKYIPKSREIKLIKEGRNLLNLVFDSIDLDNVFPQKTEELFNLQII